MKKLLIGALVFMFVGALGSNAWGACGSVTSSIQKDGTRTIRFSLDCDTLSDIGGSFQDDSTAYTGWVQVPVGISFAAFVTSPDVDSNAFGHYNDTIHVTLQTAPSLSYAVDSAGTIGQRVRRKAAVINLWSSVSTGFTKITQMQYFPAGQGVADTAFQTPNAAAAAKDTIDVAATSLKTFAFGDMSGGVFLPHNLGNLRFQIHQGTADNITDGKLRLHMFVVYHDALISDGRSYGSMFNDNKEYTYVEAQSFSESLGYRIQRVF